MPIYASPYPSQGVNNVPSKFTAERIVNMYSDIDCDGGDQLPEELGGVMEETGDLSEGRFRFRSGVGLDKIRPMIARLWEKMTSRAKLGFLRQQQFIGKTYAQQCEQLVKDHK